MWTTLLSAPLMLTLGLPPQPAQLVLHDLRASFSQNAEGAVQIHVIARAENRLPIPVESLEIGVVVAKPEGVPPADALGKIYAQALQEPVQLAKGLVLAKQFSLNVPANGQTELSLWFPWKSDTALTQELSDKSNEVLVHLLGYRLASINTDVIKTLLFTEAAADERAAALAFGLLEGHHEMALARQHWGKLLGLRESLESWVSTPVTGKPDRETALGFIFAARALGVLGGPDASAALSQAQSEGELSRFDDQFQAIRVARITGSPIDTPIAFIIPPTVDNMRALVDLAQRDAQATLDAGRSAENAPTMPPPPSWQKMFLVFCGLTVIALVIRYPLRQRAKRE